MREPRRALYGGKGIRNREEVLKVKLSNTTEADAAHDFGEGVAERDKFMASDLVRFEEIAQSRGITKFTASKNAFNAIVGSNPFQLLRTTLPANIFPSYTPSTSPKGYLNEEEALLNLGIDYRAIKRRFIEKMRAGETGKDTPIQIENITFPIPGTQEFRTYEVRGILMKDKEGQGTLNIASRFEQLTNKTDVALIIDASGGLSMTSLLNSDLSPAPNNKMNFYILENIENDSDSATKLKNFDSPKNQEGLEKQPNVFFLQDMTNTVLYPAFNVIQGQVDGEMLFGNANLLLSRAGDEMEADFTFPDGSTYHIENVSQNANVKNASLNIIASTIANGGTVSREGGIKPAPGDKTPYLYPYIKRVGDWCQALSLLDVTREYAKLDLQHSDTGERITLEGLQKNDVAVGLLTLDRILLGYALTLGIDVFFTTATDLRLLIYFRNTEEVLSDEVIQAKLTALSETFNREYAVIGKDDVQSILGEAIAFVKGSTTDTDYIRRLRGALYRISMLRTDFAVLTPKIQEIATKLNDPALSLKEKYSACFEGVTLLSKLKSDEAHNNVQRRSFTSYPAMIDENNYFQTIDIRPESRGAIASIKVVLSKKITNDANQTKQVFEKYGVQDQLKEFVNIPVKNPVVFTDIFIALNEVRRLFGGPQAGGAIDITPLKQFIITPIASKEEYENQARIEAAKGAQAPGESIEDKIPIPLVVDSYYRDKSSLPYTVVDKYIITKEDLEVFDRIYRSGFDIDPNDQLFVARRLMILYLDILQGELEKLVASEDDEQESPENLDMDDVKTAIYPSDVKTSNHVRIYYKVNQLLQTYTRFMKIGNYKDAVTDAINTYATADLLDNDGLMTAIQGADAPRNASDYVRTFEKIKTVRSLLLKHDIPPKRTGKRKPEEELAKEETPDSSKKARSVPKPPTDAMDVEKPPADAMDVKKPPVADDMDLGGGLRTEVGISTNVEGVGVRSRKHSRLRKRARTRRTPRVRKSARKSKTRR
jgi:hypothetical protein